MSRRPACLVAAVAGLLLTGCSASSAPSAAPSSPSSPSRTPSPTAATSVLSPTAAPVTPVPRNRSLDQPLIRAAARGETRRVRSLLARGAGVRARDAGRRTALVAASYGNHVAVARLLVAAGADVNVQDQTQQSAFLIATSEVGDDPRLLDLTLAGGADVRRLDSFNGTGLIRAAERGNVRIIRRLVRTDIAVDHVNRLGWTALHEAVILGNGGPRYVQVVRLLVDAGADVNRPSQRDGVRPLVHASDRGFDDVARVLRAAGARG